MGNMDVEAKLSVNTAGFDGPMKKSAEVASATGQAVSKAAKAAADAQALAAKYATTVISQETAKQIESIAATREAQSDYYRAQTFVKRGYIDEAAGSQAAAAALQRLTALRLEAAEAAKLQGNAEGAVISKQMAASGTIRLASGPDSIRAVERFISTIPGVGAALQNIFPIIGALAFAGIVVDIGEKMAKAFDVGGERAAKAASAIASLNEETDHGIDSLNVQIDKLQQEQAKFEKKPFNGMKLALDEAAEAADNLSERLDGSIEKEQAMLKLLAPSTAQTWVLGYTSNKQEDVMLQQHKKWLDNAADPHQQLSEIDSFGRTMQAHLQKLQGSQIKIDALRAMGGPTSVLASVIGTKDYSKQIESDKEIIAQNDKHRKLVQGMLSLADQQALTQNAKDHAQKTGKAPRVVDQAALDAAAALKYREEYHKKIVAEYERTQALDPREANAGIAAWSKLQQKQVESLASNTSRWAEYNAELKRTGVILANNAEAAQRFQIEMAVKTGRMSRPDAARAMADIHTADSAAKLSALEATLNGLTAALQALDPSSKDYGLKSMALGKQMASTQGQIAEVQGQAQLQGMQDQWAIFSQTAGGGAVVALQEFTSQATDSAAQIKSLIDNTISGLNRTILSTITNPAYMNRGNFENLGKSIFTDISGKALQRGEAGLLSTFGVHAGGKLGSKSNPMYTKSADLATATGGAANPVMSLIHHVFRSGTSAPPGISSSVYPGSGSGSNASSASALGSAAAALGQSLFGGGSGSGSGSGGTSSYTAPPSGVPAIVSSLVGSAVTAAIPFLDSGTNYVPHDTLAMIHQGEAVIPKKYNHPGNLGGHTVHNHITVDARGSSNPAQMHAIAYQAVLAAAPHIAAATKQSIISDNSRVAPSARKY